MGEWAPMRTDLTTTIARPLALTLAVVALLSVSSMARAQALTIAAPYNDRYTPTDIGSVPGLPDRYGGLTFRPKDTDVLLIGGTANEAGGEIYAISVVRDAASHIIGFTGTATIAVEGAFNDGGITFGPEEVMFLARWPNNELAQIKKDSVVVDKLVDLTPLGVVSSPGGLAFVPSDHPRAGALKTASWPTGEWYELAYEADGTGTFTITAATQATTLEGGPEGFIYVPQNSPLFATRSMLVSEFSANEVSVYQVDDDGDPIPGTRELFISGLTGAEGALTDPLTGDFLFSTFGGGSRVIVVRGFATPTGGPCQADDDCSSGFCAVRGGNGVCCASRCDGVCESCALADGAPEDGTCTPLDAVPCTEDACSETGTCSAGECVAEPRDCVASNECMRPTGCDPSTGCTEEPAANGTACSGGQCLAGVCQAGNVGEGEGEGEPGDVRPACGCGSSRDSMALGALALVFGGRRRLRRRKMP